VTALRFDGLTLGYDRHPAVHHLTTSVARGSLTAVVGPNGAGKSTLLKAISGALPVHEGRIERDVCGIAWLPQQSEVDRSFPVSIREFVAMGLWSRAGAFGRIGAPDRTRIADALAAVGLNGFDRRPIGALSGGQMQRVLFARVLLQGAELILLDEPFTAIDAKTTADLLGIVRRWHSDGRTVIAVLHDLETVRTSFPRTMLLARELIAHGATASTLTPENLFRARQMPEALDDRARPCERGAAA
jgi:zinc/manganese transport system ATP-binding protein